MIKLGVSGACGKMGRRIISLAKQDRDIKVTVGLENKGHPDIGKYVEAVKITDDLQQIKECDCLIDFSSPHAAIGYISYLEAFKKCAVIGTTGFSCDQKRKIEDSAENVPIVFSPNMSVGVNVLFKLVQQAAQILKKYNVYVEETHHIHKKDAPSGTAKKIAEIINKEGFNLQDSDIKAIRENEIVGDHKIVFESGVDKLELFHSAKTRDIFAEGAILAAKWVVSKPKGLYSMDDVLFGAGGER